MQNTSFVDQVMALMDKYDPTLRHDFFYPEQLYALRCDTTRNQIAYLNAYFDLVNPPRKMDQWLTWFDTLIIPRLLH